MRAVVSKGVPVVDDRNRCAWVDRDGVRCPGVANSWRSTRGGGKGYCAGHAACPSAMQGDRVVEQQVMDGGAYPLTPHERRVLVRRMSPPSSGSGMDVPTMLRRRAENDQRQALAVYDAELRTHISRGLTSDEAHKRAIAALYQAGRRAALSMPAPRLVGADRQAGEGGDR